MKYYDQDEMDGQPRMTFSPTGRHEDARPHGFLGMSAEGNRRYATRWLLDLWEKDINAVVWLDGQPFEPTDEDIADANERREAVMAALKGHKPHVQVAPDLPEALVSAKVEVEEVLHEEDAPKREGLAAAMARFRSQKKKRTKCAPGGKRLRAKARA